MDKKTLNKAVRTDDILAEIYGRKKLKTTGDPLTELVMTVLSQNTNDLNRDRAFAGLKSRYPEWSDLLKTSKPKLASAIRVGGLANVKSGRILKMLKSLQKLHGELNLDFLSDWSDEDVREYLLKIEGVGPKTAACVLAFALGRDVMPVDTHVHRVSLRLGLIPSGMTAEAAHDWFLELRGTVGLYQFHLNLIAHGRQACKARNPRCAECRLKRICDFFNREIKRSEQAA